MESFVLIPSVLYEQLKTRNTLDEPLPKYQPIHVPEQSVGERYRDKDDCI